MQEADDAPMSVLFQNVYLELPSSRIAAGTDKTMRNILGNECLICRENRASIKMYRSMS